MKSSCFFAIFVALVGFAVAEWRNIESYTDPACKTLATVTSVPIGKCSDYPSNLYNGSCTPVPQVVLTPLWSKITCGALTPGADYFR
jgi:hypothetical protein